MIFALVICAAMMDGDTMCQKSAEFQSIEGCVLEADKKLLGEMAENFNAHPNVKGLSVMCVKGEKGQPV